MVHKRFIKRNGKIFGPYYYKSVREKDGKVKNIYLGSTTPSSKLIKEKKQHSRILLVLILVFGMLGVIFFSGVSDVIPTGAVVTIEADGDVLSQGHLMKETNTGYAFNAERGNDNIKLENIKGEPEKVNVEFNTPNSRIFNTNIVAVTGLTSASAIIELEKKGNVESIFYCPEYDTEKNICSQWQKTDIPFEVKGNKIVFTVTHFSAYVAGSDSELEIIDDTEFGTKKSYDSSRVESWWNVTFYANYSNATIGPIDGTCEIRFQNYSGFYDESYIEMIYSNSERRYLFSRNFTYDGTYNFEVNCTNSTYANLNLTDTFYITNSPPHLKYLTQYLPPQECDEDTVCTYYFAENITEFDYNDLPLQNYTYALGTEFSCFSLDTNSGIITVNCQNNGQAGNYKTTILVTDQDGESTTAIYNITINAVNDYPYFVTTSPLASATENNAYNNFININDEEQGSISSGAGAIGHFSFTINDTSIFQINRTTGRITNSTALTNALVGTYYLQINVTDSATPTNATNSTVFALTIQNFNDPPNITFACDNNLTWDEDDFVSCYINATDIDSSDNHDYTANYSWFNFSCTNINVANGNTSCLVNFVANDSAVYAHWINITVMDSGGLTDSVVINFTVNNVPDFPYFYNISNMTAWANAPFSYQVEARDDDNATQFPETLYYWDNTSIFNISTNTGLISFTPTSLQTGTYWVNISVNDSTDRWNSTVINFTIFPNDVPLYNGSLEFNMTEGYLFEVNLSLNSSDPDVDTITFSDNTSLFNITSTGKISITPADSDVGTHWVLINITDEHGAPNSTLFNFTIYNEDDAPVLTTIPNRPDDSEGVAISFTIEADDDDCDIPGVTNCTAVNPIQYLRFRMNVTVPGMVLNSVTGKFTWTPSATQNGTYWINFTVNDSTGLEDSQVIFINVSDAAFPPRFIDTDSAFCTGRTATEDEEFSSCTIIACDNDTNAVLRIAANYSWFNNNINTSNITGINDSRYGFCVNTTLNFTPDYTHVGNYTVLLNVTDITGSYATFNLSFNISSKNDAPVWIIIAQQQLIIDEEYNYNLSANVTDEENDVLNFFANDTLSQFNITINRTTGLLIGTPNSSMNGTYRVNFTVNDTSGAEDSQVVVFAIGENFAPRCTAEDSSLYIINPTRGLLSDPPLRFNMSENQSTGNFITACSDNEGNDFTYQWLWNGTVNSSGQYPIWNYTTTFLDAGIVNITLIVNDSATQSNSYYWNVTVFDLNAPPMMYSNIPNITKMPTWLSSSAWYKNRDSYINLSNYFFDFDNENLTYIWYRYAINESFNDNSFSRINSTWHFTGKWYLVNDTANPILRQNDTSGLKVAYESTYINITEAKAKIKIFSGGAAGFCFGDSSCSDTARKVFLNMTDNTTNFEFLSSSAVEAYNNSYSLDIANQSYIWLKSVFSGNNTLLYASANGNQWNLTQNLSVALNSSSSTFSIFTINADAAFDDIVLKDPDLRNFTVSFSRAGDKLTFNPSTGWHGDLAIAVRASDGRNETDSNIFGLHIDDVSEPAPVVITQTTTSSSTSRVTQVASLNIIVPSLISLTPLSKTIIPVILQNTGDLNLNILDLIAYSNQSALTLTLEQANWTILSVGQSVNTNLDIDIGLLTPDRYTISLTGTSKIPNLTEKVEIVIDVREKDAVLKAQLKEQIQFTRDLFLQNPECLELWELIEEAEKLMATYQYEEGLNIIHSANQGCKDFIALDSEKITKEKLKSFLELYWKTIAFEVAGLILAVLLLIYYFKRRRFAKPI
ncbi:MAG: hypothetical protein KKB39_02135 [Nanoarchaeota archaeon]|nr:hypothetical protein [Nanoarchaeota archaeon]